MMKKFHLGSTKQRIFMIVELQPSGLPKEIFKAFLHWYLGTPGGRGGGGVGGVEG